MIFTGSGERSGAARRLGGRRRFTGARGAAVVEYALGVGLICIATMGGIQALEDGSADELDDRADRSGAPDLEEPSGDSSGEGSTGGGGDGDDTPAGTMEVFFGGFSSIGAKKDNPWIADLTVNVADVDGRNVGGVRVEGEWSYLNGSVMETVPAVCNQTGNSGSCKFQLNDIPGGVVEVTFTMIDISGGDPPVAYDGGAQSVTVHKSLSGSS